MRLDLHPPRLPPIVVTLGFFEVIAGGPTPCLAARIKVTRLSLAR